MGLVRGFLGALVLVTIVIACPARADIWLESSTTKVLKSAVTSGATTIEIESARNEWVSFQVVISTEDQQIDDVTVVLTDFTGPQGAVIPASDVELFREYYVDITEPSFCEIYMNTSCAEYPEYVREPGLYPDALIPFDDPYDHEHPSVGAPFDVLSNDLQTVFVDLRVPKDIPAGEYGASVSVTAGGENVLATMNALLTVWDFDLPDQRNITTAFGFSFDKVAEYHGGIDGGTVDERERFKRNYVQEVHKHRIDITRWELPQPAFEFDSEDVLVPVDFSAFDAYVGPRIDGTYFDDGIGIRQFALTFFRPGSGLYGMTENQYSQAAKSMIEHLQEKGWLDAMYLYSTDEPWLPSHAGAIEEIRDDVLRLRASSDLWNGHVMVTGPWLESLNDYVDIWCPVTAMYDDDFWPDGAWAGREEYAELMAQGRTLWFYVCNANFPALMGYDIDTWVGHEPRLLKWGAWIEGAKGFLYWRLTYWLNEPNPWDDLANVDGFDPAYARNGDGILIYPGDHNGSRGSEIVAPWPGFDGPLPSYRLKQIRDGLEDWEMMLMADDLQGGDYVREQVRTVYNRFGDSLDYAFDPDDRPWSMDDDELLVARRNIAAKVQYLSHPDQYEDPEIPALADDVAGDGFATDVSMQSDTASGDQSAVEDVVEDGDVAIVDVGGGEGDAGPVNDPGQTTADDGAQNDSGAVETSGGDSGCNGSPAGHGTSLPRAFWFVALIAMIPLTGARFYR